MNQKLRTHPGQKAHRTIIRIAGALAVLLSGLPASAQLAIQENAIEIPGTDGGTSVTDQFLGIQKFSTFESAILDFNSLLILKQGVVMTRVDADGVTFPDSSLQTSAAYSKAEIDEILGALDVCARRSVRPTYFLTPETYSADQVLTACGDGFHMASIFELADPSYLVYDSTRGLQTDDSGWGPPLSADNPPLTRYGWVRTGAVSGDENCDLWTSTSEEAFGSVAGARFDMSELTPGWSVLVNILGPDCSQQMRVWCIEDPVVE